MHPNPIASSVPQPWLEGCIAAHRRLEVLIAHLTDDVARRPSLLDGWTVGHLLTHLARNADSHAGMVEAARRGEMAAQYPGGAAQREAGIADGYARPASALVADVRAANRRLERAWATTSAETWATGLGLRLAGPTTIADFVFLRWREVEVHLVDLGLADVGGPDWDGLSAPYRDLEWQETLCGLGARVPDGMTLVLAPGDRPARAGGAGGDTIIIRATPGRILGWLLGRGGDPAWPVLRPWA